MIHQQQLDAVMVLADADKQASIICDCLEAGLHVMSEVPLCYTLEDCWRIVTTVERTGKVFLLMEQIRYGGYVQAWRNIVQSGVLGEIVLAEGEYFHNLPLRMYQDNDGVYYTAKGAQHNRSVSPTWRLRQPPIVYLPHDLSPVLSVLDDRVTRVVGMESNHQTATTPNQDYPSLQMALMHTQKDAVLRMGVSFNTAAPERHWQHIKGTRGYVEMPRTADESYLMWVDQWQLPAPLKMPWGLSRVDAPAAAVGSGHGDCDYYVFAAFADAVLRDVPLEFDVYCAVEITAPAILAAHSIQQGGVSLEVPDFRPNPQRKTGVLPKQQ
jgi:predicted dehydrogenase